MNYTRLGRTGLKVSRLCLGAMQFGWTADKPTSFAILDAFVEQGGNFIDTADVYSRWAPGNQGGESERILGEWMAKRGNRGELVLATKVRGRMWEGPNGDGLSRMHIMRAVEDSLERLQTDYIDLYQTHSYDGETPIEETLSALDDLVHGGDVRYLGCSNYPAWRLARALWASDVGGLARYDVLQPHYNLIYREEYERELGPLCEDQQVGVIPYSPLQAGFLTGKYHQGEPLPNSARAARIESVFMTERNLALVDQMADIAASHGATISQVALAWLLAKPMINAPIVGANSVEQLGELMPAVDLKLSAEAMATLDAATAWREG